MNFSKTLPAFLAMLTLVCAKVDKHNGQSRHLLSSEENLQLFHDAAIMSQAVHFEDKLNDSSLDFLTSAVAASDIYSEPSNHEVEVEVQDFHVERQLRGGDIDSTQSERNLSSPDCTAQWCSYQYEQKKRGKCREWTMFFGIKAWCDTYAWDTVNTNNCKHLWGSRPLQSYEPNSLVDFERISGTGSNTECEDRDDIGDNGCSWDDDCVWGDALPFGLTLLKIWQCH